jgi:hypothetical protein
MGSHRIVKWFRDYADDIEAVNIHYAVTALGDTPDWNHTRTTRYMPLIGRSIRFKELRLPPFVCDSLGRRLTHYVLHYYFEVCQGGDRHYSPLYSEEIVTESKDSPSKDVVEPGDEVEQSQRSRFSRHDCCRIDAGLEERKT